MDFEPVNLSHIDEINESLSKINTIFSEYSFANLYLFREYHNYRYGKINGIPLIKGESYDNHSFCMILEDFYRLDEELIVNLLSSCDYIFPLESNMRKNFNENIFTFDYNDGDSDYIYTVEKMSTYKGRKLHKKRNLLKQHNLKFFTEHCKMDESNIEDAEFVLEKWLEDVDMKIDETDYRACKEALEKKKELGLCGVLYYSDEEPSGFILGEGLNSETFVMHFAKGLRKFKGIYQFMYNSFAKKLPKHYEYINFEQDLGKLALKIAKSSYVPDLMLRKYRMKLKDL